MNRIIECGTNENDIVLDFFGGSCSTAASCKQLNRNYIVGELDKTYCKKGIEWVDSIDLYSHSFFS